MRSAVEVTRGSGQLPMWQWTRSRSPLLTFFSCFLSALSPLILSSPAIASSIRNSPPSSLLPPSALLSSSSRSSTSAVKRDSLSASTKPQSSLHACRKSQTVAPARARSPSSSSPSSPPPVPSTPPGYVRMNSRDCFRNSQQGSFVPSELGELAAGFAGRGSQIPIASASS